MTIIGHASSPDPLPDSFFTSEAVASHVVAASIAGRARYAHELAIGVNQFPEEPPATMNPQGNPGHDHSGPPYGGCFRHPIAWWSASDIGSNLISPANPLSRIVGEAVTSTFVFWVRPHSPLPDRPNRGVAPYGQLFLYILAHLDGGASDLDLSVETLDPASGQFVGSTDTTSGISGLASSIVTLALAPTHPGRNVVRLRFTPENDNTVTIDAWSLCNIVKRFHAP